MARKILCTEDAAESKDACKRYSEYFEGVEGELTRHVFCDNCGKPMHPGERAVAAMILPSKSHHSYEPPARWADEYLRV